MKCPRCDAPQMDFKLGRIVPAVIDKCAYCGYPIEDRTYLNQSLEKAQECVNKYKKSNDNKFLFEADAYFKAALAEVGKARG